MPSRVSVALDRGLAYWPAKRPMRITGRRAPITSTMDICNSTFSRLVMRAARQSTALEHKLPPCRRFAQLLAQVQNFPTRNQRGQRVQFSQDPFDFSRVLIAGLLEGGFLPPGVG